MTDDEREELNELRRYKAMHEGRALNRAFARLEVMLDTVNRDPAMSIRAFRVLAECLICLKEEVSGR